MVVVVVVVVVVVMEGSTMQDKKWEALGILEKHQQVRVGSSVH